MAWECTTYATQHGTGWRADSLGDLGSFSPTWNHMRHGYPSWIRQTKVENAWKTGPIAYEPPHAVAEFVEKGWPLRWIFNYNEVRDTIPMPADLVPDDYSLSIAVVGEKSGEPVVRLGIKGRADDGWYPLSKVSVTR